MAGKDPGPEMQLEAAIHREIMLGDLKGAMEQYRAVLSQPGKSKRVAARALFQMGRCLEKLGRRVEARTMYGRLLNEYGDEREIVVQARAQLAAWNRPLPGPRNLDFEQGVPGKVPPGWFVLALPKDADDMAQWRREGCKGGTGCTVVPAPAKPYSNSNLMQSFDASAYLGKTVRLAAWLRVEALDLDDRAQVWLSVDRPSRRQGFFDNMSDRPVRSADWTRFEILCPVDRDATFINFGIMFFGRGRVWVDDVSFEVIK
jgi:hypothetical protein